MTCYMKPVLGGSIFFCGDLGPHCADHRCNWLPDNLCDYPVGPGKTCDRPICADHSYEIGPDIHYCASHYKAWEKFVADGGVKKVLENVLPYSRPPRGKRA